MSNKFKSLVYREKGGRRSPWTCNFYLGCSNACTYCCCTYIIKHNWSSSVKLMKHFKSEEHALQIFREEVEANLESLRSRGRLFFSLTTDCMLPETKNLTYSAMQVCHELDVPFKILTKCTDWLQDDFLKEFEISGTLWGQVPKMDLFAFGFSLTGFDQIEIGAASNEQRIQALKKIKKLGFKTFISFEPVIDFDISLEIIRQSHEFCDFMRVGLLNGPTRDKNPDLIKMKEFYETVNSVVNPDIPIYWGDNFVNFLKLDRLEMPSNCVEEEVF
jgi:DNA repair photolyase